MPEPTEEQRLILDERESAVVMARPGSGRTFTLALKIRSIVSTLPEYKGVIAISYTNKASDELRRRCLQSGFDKKNSYFGTIDRFFIGEVIFPFLPHLFGKAPVELAVIKGAELPEEGDRQSVERLRVTDSFGTESNIAELKTLYNRGYVPLDLVGKLAVYVYDRSLACRRYLKARYSHVIVDEYQDSGHEQHQVFVRLHTAGLVAIAVGDLNQSIYAFSGKSSTYLSELANNTAFKTFALTLNHRCHPSISNYSLKLMSASAVFNPEPEQRVYSRIANGSELEIAKFIDKAVPQLKDKFHLANNNAFAILVRGGRTGELVSSILQTKHRYFKETLLDSESSLWAQVFKSILLFASGNSITRFEILEEDFGLETDSANAQNVLGLLASIRNWVQTPTEIMPVSEFVQIASILFPNAESTSSVKILENVLSDSSSLHSYRPAGEDELQIMTLHKSKGLEFDVVFHLDLYQWILPGYDAIKGNQESLVQDLNLHYVGVTRAKLACILCSSSRRHRKKQNSDNLEIIDAQESSFFARNQLSTLRKQV